MSWNTWLTEQAAARDAAGLRRALSPRSAQSDILDLAGNDYLGLLRDPRLIDAAVAATQTWGTGAGASRLVTGSTQLHTELDVALAEHLRKPAALTFSSGYLANLAVITALAGRDCLVISDAHNHASLIDAVRLSRAETMVVEHADADAVGRALAQAHGRRTLVATESIFSVYGDAAPLADLAELTAAAGALLIVDEAHGVGVGGDGGRGLVADLDPAQSEHVIVTATLSKALGAQGGVVAGPVALIDHLINRARPFIYDTGLAPAPAAAALAALDILAAEPERATRVRARAAQLAFRFDVPVPAGAVLSLPMAGPREALDMQAQLLDLGIRVGCFRPPSTPDGSSRLRLTVNGAIPTPQWNDAVDLLGKTLPFTPAPVPPLDGDATGIPA